MSEYYRPPYVRIGPSLTPMVKYLIIANVAVYFLQFLTRGMLDGLLAVSPLCFRSFYLWQLFTYMFLHSRYHVLHLVFNMFVLWMLGCDLERHWGSRRFLQYYLVCGVGAGFIIAVTAFFGGGLTLGASGAIFGLMVAFAIVFPNAVILAFFLFPIRARTFVMILIAVELFSMVTYAADNVSHLGHVGGALVGYLYLRRFRFLRNTWDRLRWKWRQRKHKREKFDDGARPYFH
jgi:membrane associated rhomboid family serine protease